MKGPAVVLLTVVQTVSLLAHPASAQTPEYAALIDRYASGDVAGAAAALAAWDRPRVQQALRAQANEAAAHLKAAAMLHTEAGFVASAPDVPFHVDIAWRLLDRLQDDRFGLEPGDRLFTARWHALAAIVHLAHLDARRARMVINRGLTIDRKNAEIRLVAGWMLEMQLRREQTNLRGRWNLESSGRFGSDIVAQHQTRMRELTQVYAGIVADHPDSFEARLRLGFVQLVNKSPDNARETLQPVAARSARGDLQYLAHLFLSGLEEQAGRLDEAAAHAEAAYALSPMQSSLVALMRIETARGHTDRVQTLGASFAARGDDVPPDLWNFYNMGFTGGGLLSSLRTEARGR